MHPLYLPSIDLTWLDVRKPALRNTAAPIQPCQISKYTNKMFLFQIIFKKNSTNLYKQDPYLLPFYI